MLKENFILLLVSVSLAVKTPPEEDFYYAAVVEYSPLKGESGKDTLMKNVNEYASLIDSASKKADIIVFPEEGLMYYDSDYSHYIEVPFGNNTIAPVDDEHAHPALRMISKAARNNEVYVVINLREEYHPDNTTRLNYNTDVIFDRTGKIIGRYRKFHLFAERLNITDRPEHVYFDSDFGVRFGIFTCFDILFEDPALRLLKEYNVTDVIYPTWWFSGLPFFTAVQTQAGWAYATETNLLSSGGNNVIGANTGSGIYLGKQGPIVYLQSQRDETCILFGKVIKKGKTGSPSGWISDPTRLGPHKKLHIWEDPVTKLINSSLITPNEVPQNSLEDPQSSLREDKTVQNKKNYSKTLCHNEFCCDFYIDATFNYKKRDNSSTVINDSFNPYIYRLAVFNGVSTYGVAAVAGIQLCAIISCLNSSVESCGKPLPDSQSLPAMQSDSNQLYYLHSTVFNNVKIKTSMLEEGSFTFPSLLELSTNSNVFGSLINISNFSYNIEKSVAELNFSSDRLITGSLYTRVFSRDPSPSFGISLFNFNLNIFIVLIISVLFCLQVYSSYSS